MEEAEESVLFLVVLVLLLLSVAGVNTNVAMYKNGIPCVLGYQRLGALKDIVGNCTITSKSFDVALFAMDSFLKDEIIIVEGSFLVVM